MAGTKKRPRKNCEEKYLEERTEGGGWRKRRKNRCGNARPNRAGGKEREGIVSAIKQATAILLTAITVSFIDPRFSPIFVSRKARRGSSEKLIIERDAGVASATLTPFLPFPWKPVRRCR